MWVSSINRTISMGMLPASEALGEVRYMHCRIYFAKLRSPTQDKGLCQTYFADVGSVQDLAKTFRPCTVMGSV